MQRNHTSIWDNFSRCFGRKSAALNDALAESMTIALDQARANTKARQSWKLQNTAVFHLFRDAPEWFFHSHYERQIIQDFDSRPWTEAFATTICRERDRALILVAHAPSPVPQSDTNSVSRLLETAANAYRFLYTKTESNGPTREATESNGVLSSREVECLQWLASGKTLAEAAMILGISERTLRYHISNARERLGVATTVQAIVAAALTYGFDPRDARRSICATSRP